MQSGAYELGVMDSIVWKSEVKEGKVDAKSVSVIGPMFLRAIDLAQALAIAMDARGFAARDTRTSIIAIDMTTAQLGKRLGVSQQRAAMVEKAEVDGSITLKSLEQAAQTLGCRVVYVLYPEEPLTPTLHARAEAVADQQMRAVEQTMRLEDQSVADSSLRLESHLVPQSRDRRHRVKQPPACRSIHGVDAALDHRTHCSYSRGRHLPVQR